jgi:hypothetical protein
MLFEKFKRAHVQITVLVPPDKSLLSLLEAYTAGKLASTDLQRILELHYIIGDYTVAELLNSSSSAFFLFI